MPLFLSFGGFFSCSLSFFSFFGWFSVLVCLVRLPFLLCLLLLLLLLLGGLVLPVLWRFGLRLCLRPVVCCVLVLVVLWLVLLGLLVWLVCVVRGFGSSCLVGGFCCLLCLFFVVFLWGFPLVFLSSLPAGVCASASSPVPSAAAGSFARRASWLLPAGSFSCGASFVVVRRCGSWWCASVPVSVVWGSVPSSSCPVLFAPVVGG